MFYSMWKMFIELGQGELSNHHTAMAFKLWHKVDWLCREMSKHPVGSLNIFQVGLKVPIVPLSHSASALHSSSYQSSCTAVSVECCEDVKGGIMSLGCASECRDWYCLLASLCLRSRRKLMFMFNLIFKPHKLTS